MAGALKRNAGFTLLEMIGVLAVMGIMAAAVTPSALRSLQRAAIASEGQTVAALGNDVSLYLRDRGVLPPAAAWASSLGPYAGLGTTAIATNGRGVDRVLLLDPAANPAPRALILSGMRRGLALPAANAITTAAAFDQIWQTADGAVPPASSWAGWNAWAAVANSGESLVIGRINLGPVYATDLRSYTITLNNRAASAASYDRVLGDGTLQPAVNVAAGATLVLANQTPRTRINLYRSPGGAALVYSYVLSASGKTFDFDGVHWNPQ